MAYELYLRLYDRLGSLKKGYLNPLWARYTDSVNKAAPIVFALNTDSDGVDQIAEFDLVEVMIRNLDLGLFENDNDFVSAYRGLVRDWDLSTNDDNVEFIEFKCPGLNHILDLRSILWSAGFENRAAFAGIPAETILKTLVSYNCTDLASTGNGRQRNGDLLPGMGFDVRLGYDNGGGEILSASFKGGKLLGALQRVADQAGGDFALSWLGGQIYQFDFYPGQLGDDKSSGSERVLFAISNQTMRNPRLIRTGATATSAIAGGDGQEELRNTSEAFGPDYASDYDIEIFVDARQEKTAAGRVYRADLKLDEKRIKERLTFEVQQTGNQFYSPIAIAGRKTYKPGDLVAAVYPDEQIRKVETVRVYWKDPSNDDAFVVDVETKEVFQDGS